MPPLASMKFEGAIFMPAFFTAIIEVFDVTRVIFGGRKAQRTPLGLFVLALVTCSKERWLPLADWEQWHGTCGRFRGYSKGSMLRNDLKEQVTA
ncbi:hypothetical protein BDW69DRAFT_178937 [Aspergillus filifer]